MEKTCLPALRLTLKRLEIVIWMQPTTTQQLRVPALVALVALVILVLEI